MPASPTSPHAARTRRRRATRLLATAALALATTAGMSATPAAAATTNPLAGHKWGVYTGTADGIYPAYQQATGATKKLLAKIALRPRVRWFGSWIATADISKSISGYIASEQAGNPSVLAQLAIFRVFPHGEGALSKPLNATDQKQYKAWIDAAARGIGAARVAVVLEPDLAVSRGGAGASIRYALARYAAKRLGALPHAAVYLDGASSDWLTAAQSADMLKASGVQYVRGFALNATHYTATGANDLHGADVVTALAHRGLPGKHFVVNTADTGRPFTYGQYYTKHPHGDFDNAEVCATRSSVRCVTLGIPPTTNVSNPAFHLSASAAAAARRSCDGYLWFGRPWLVRQSSPYSQSRALQIARTTPY